MTRSFAQGKTSTDRLPPHEEYRRVRKRAERLCETLETENFVLHAMAAVSPAKWHLAHTTRFFEAFILETFVKGRRPIDSNYRFPFSSYYNTVSGIGQTVIFSLDRL